MTLGIFRCNIMIRNTAALSIMTFSITKLIERLIKKTIMYNVYVMLSIAI
jgi:hypothetical protein